MRSSVPTYPSGDDIRIGDHIAFASSPGRVVLVIATRSYSTECPEVQWSYLEEGFMIEAEAYGLVHLVEPDEDLILVNRG